MATSTITDKGQTIIPKEIRTALKVKPRQRLEWSVSPDGSAIVRPEKSALQLFRSLKSSKTFSTRRAEIKAVAESFARRNSEKT